MMDAPHTILWSDDLKLGLPEIDKGHKQLVDLCNRFVSAADDPDSSGESLAAILADLTAAAQAHFSTEETLLDRNGFPDLGSHRADHDRLLVQIQTLRQRFQNLGPHRFETGLFSETAEFLHTWLIDHIRDDRPFRPFIRNLS